MTDAAKKRWRDRAIARLQKRWNMSYYYLSPAANEHDRDGQTGKSPMTSS